MGLRLFRPCTSDGFQWVQPVETRDSDSLHGLDGHKLAAEWTPVAVRLVAAQEEKIPRRADMPWLDDQAIVFRDAALPVVREILTDFGEFLELRSVDDGDRLWMFNVCTVIDALDEPASEIVRFPSTGRIMRLLRPAFHASRVKEVHAFRLPDVRALFVSEPVVQVIQAEGLTGTSFKQVWEG